MNLNLKDPDSIVRWWRCFPERHWLYLEVFEARTPQFRLAIRSARQRIKAEPLFSRCQNAALTSAGQSDNAPLQLEPADEGIALAGASIGLH